MTPDDLAKGKELLAQYSKLTDHNEQLANEEAIFDWLWTHRAELVRLAEVGMQAREIEWQRRDGRALLHRLVTYCREDEATTKGVTRLERLVAKVDGYLSRTHDPRDVLRSPRPEMQHDSHADADAEHGQAEPKGGSG